MKTDQVVSTNEIDFVLKALEDDLRADGRTPFEMRPLDIKFHKDGTAEVQVGKTRVIAVVAAELVVPFPDRPSEGTFAVNVELSPMASPSFEAGRPGEEAVELAKALERGFKDSGALDLEGLAVLAGRAVWAVRLDAHVVDHGGSLAGAAALAALAALISHRRPEVSVRADTGAITVHPVEMREAIPLALHHLPVAVEFALLGEDGRHVVLDPSIVEEAAAGGTITVTANQHKEVCAVHKAGGVAVPPAQLLRCIRIAAGHAGEMVDRLKKAEAAYRLAALQARIRRKRAPGAAVLAAERPVPMEVSTLGEDPAAALAAANAAVAAAAAAAGGAGDSDSDVEGDADIELEEPAAAIDAGLEDAWDMVDAEAGAAGGGGGAGGGSLLRLGGAGTGAGAGAGAEEDGQGGGGSGKRGKKKKKAQGAGGGAGGAEGEGEEDEFDRVAKGLMGAGQDGSEKRDAKRRGKAAADQGPPPTSLLDAVKAKKK